MDKYNYKMFKISVALIICFIAETILGTNDFFYACSAIMICMFDSKVQTGLTRVLGIFFGAVLATLVIIISKFFDIYVTRLYFLFVAIMIIPIMYIPFKLNRRFLILPAGFAFMAITTNCNIDADGWQNIIEITAAFTVGTLIIMLLNIYVPTAKPNPNVLFISDLDGTLLNKNKQISILSMGIINGQIRNGMNFTVATARTPATVTKIMKDIDMRLPVVCMNGSAIYDIKANKYIHTEKIDADIYMQAESFVKRATPNYIVHCVENDYLNVYYDNLENDVIKKFYEERKELELKKFIKGSPQNIDNVIFIMVLDESEKVESLYSKLIERDFAKKLTVVKYKDIYNEGYSYLEIYSQNASKTNGMLFVKELCGAEKTVAFGDNDNDVDMLKNADISFAVKNASAEAKKYCYKVIGSNERDSVAETLRTFKLL